MVEITKRFGFEAAHLLPRVPEGHKCRRLHGHSFRFKVRVRGEVSPETGWLMDFGEITGIVQPLVTNELDHRYLNDIKGLENPTSEQLAIWLWSRIKPLLPDLCEIEVSETCTSSCIYRGT
ncbi:MAG: 6-carboxytetrahydropterin synthase QueD [Spirochaetales bacterium]|nr:6-carboxytetrahydropterin synthase QueD [Leptospiraceae bacterium]MCP5483631.1 6-carboxytetrahydropterin synthase QueD [Spirochaetales bacterium]MCP5484504.1 6-carboxytetrahydropterin synthase QueD [Spirochaetales bacterium]